MSRPSASTCHQYIPLQVLLIKIDPNDIVLGPPRTSFMSATSSRNASKAPDAERRESDAKDRLPFRSKGGAGDDRLRDRPSHIRPRRGEGEQDSEGWSMVKPRKSFGTEGAERFNGRMGGDRNRDDRRFKDREYRDEKDKPRGIFSRDKDGEREHDSRRNGNGRGRNEPSWFKDDAPPTPRDRPSNGDRYPDRNRGWREKDDRGDRGDRRWDRDREPRHEREPEWMDEPAEEKSQAHTQEDFQKWKEQMQGRDRPDTNKGAVETTPAKAESGQASFFGLEKPKEPAIRLDTGPDKFFGIWAAPKDEIKPEADVKKEGPAVGKPVGKASRFTSFFAPQEQLQRVQTDPTPAARGPALPNGLTSLLQEDNNAQSQSEREAFQMLLNKLHRGHETGSTPPASAVFQKPPQEQPRPNAVPEGYQQFRNEDSEEPPPNFKHSQPPGLQDLLHQRQATTSQPTVRPDQILQDLVVQRQNAQSQTSARPEQPERRTSNTDFLMGLMQSGKPPPEQQRPEQMLMGMQPQRKQPDRLQQQIFEREQEMQREAAARRDANPHRRPQAPPGFFDDSYRGPPPHEQNPRNGPQQPTQILQRPPPGLEQLPPNWNHQMPPPPPQPSQQQQQQLRMAPPGLSSRGPPGPPPGMPPPQQMFPPGFPMANFMPPHGPPPPPEGMVGPGPPGRMQPPPGFYGGPPPPQGPPPGFLPTGMGFANGMEGMGGFGFDGRGVSGQGQGQGQGQQGQGGFRR